MAILGIGTDLVHIPRIAALCRRRGMDKLAARILSPKERRRWDELLNEQTKIQFLAVRWGVKEAAYKALHPTFRPFWKDFTYDSVLTTDHRKPSLLYHPINESVDELPLRLHVSVSHDGEYTLAYVLAEAQSLSL